MFSATFLYLIFATFVFALLVIYLLKSDIKAGVEFMDKFEMYGALFVICCFAALVLTSLIFLVHKIS